MSPARDVPLGGWCTLCGTRLTRADANEPMRTVDGAGHRHPRPFAIQPGKVRKLVLTFEVDDNAVITDEQLMDAADRMVSFSDQPGMTYEGAEVEYS